MLPCSDLWSGWMPGLALMALAWLVCSSTAAAEVAERGALACEAIPGATFRLGGVMGERINANVENWLLPAPDANPGMLEMFRQRDREPAPQLVPWAGEFVGKYLISAVQARRMMDHPQLESLLREVIAELISTQAEDGYLGPFRREERLLGHWDMWGHYHVMLALLMWHADTGDRAALDGAVRAADLICNTYLDTGRRVLDAGSHEMNMAVIHSLGWLYRLTGTERYRRMMQEIEKDWESAGDYLRTGVAGVEFYRTPRPRWESLHDLQGLVELYRITGEEQYKKAFIQHWTTIMQYDRHPSGGFTTGEQAIGNPYTPGAIETCCTTAWMALSADLLRLTGDPQAADELELSTWNSMLGSQHPSGRWWTYNTPVNGVREASAHTIVFQARYGTPELNCCSVNAPRGLGVLSEWAVMRDADGIFVNYYGPGEIALTLADGTSLTLRQETRYPLEGRVRLTLGLAEAEASALQKAEAEASALQKAEAEASAPQKKEQPADFTLRLRIPGWSANTAVRLNGEPVPDVQPGRYLPLKREWRDSDTIELDFDMRLRAWPGELSAHSRAALYRGPLMLAFDPKFNTQDTNHTPALDLAHLEMTPTTAPCRFQPLLLLECPAQNGERVVLCDFATAGAHGTDYLGWLPVVNAGPPPVWLKRPRAGERVASGPVLFEWTGYGNTAATGRTFTLTVATDPACTQVVARQEGLRWPRAVVPPLLKGGQGGVLAPGQTYYWKVTATNPHGTVESLPGPRPFSVDAALENTVEEELALYELGERSLMAASPLDGDGTPSHGILESAVGITPAADRFGREGSAVAFGGEGCAIKYRLPYFPEDHFTFYAWVYPEGLPTDRLHQVFSAWATGMDDPLRVVFDGPALFARIEARGVYGTAGVPAENGRWIHVATVKEGPRLSLYVDGELKQTADAPEWVFSAATDFALGANPHYGGNECFVGRIDDFAFHAQAFTAEEIAAVYQDQL